MGLGGAPISSWEDMKKTLLEKYQDNFGQGIIGRSYLGCLRERRRTWRDI